MKRTRRSILKSGVAGLVAAGGAGVAAAAGSGETVPFSPKAVIAQAGNVSPSGNPGEYSVAITVAVNAGGFLLQFGSAIDLVSFDEVQNLSRSAPGIISAIESSGGPRLEPSDLLYLGFDFFRP